MVRITGFICGALLLGSWVTDCAASSSRAEATDEAIRYYLDGDVVGAVRRLEAELGSAENTETLSVNLDPLRTLVDFCRRSQDSPCLVKWAPALYRVMLELKAPNEVVRRAWDLEAGFYMSLVAEIALSDEHATDALEKYLALEDKAIYDRSNYVARQLLGARLYVKLDDRAAARVSIDRALAAVLSLEKASGQAWSVATDLVDCVRTLSLVGDSERAAGLLYTAGNFIAQAIPSSTIDSVRYRALESEILLNRGDLIGGNNAARLARDALDRLKLPNEAIPAWSYEVNLQLAFSGLLSGNKQALEQGLIALEELIDLAELRRSAKWKWQGQVNVVVLRQLATVLSAGRADLRDVALLRATPSFSTATRFDELFDLNRRVGLLLAERSLGGNSVTEDFRSVARDYAVWVRKRARYTFDVFPRPEASDRIIATMIELFLAMEGGSSPSDLDLAVLMADIGSRGDRSNDSIAQTLLGKANSTEERRLLHQNLRLSSRRNKYEQTELKRLMEQARMPAVAGEYPKLDFARVRLLGEFSDELNRAHRYFAKNSPDLNSDPLLPNVSEIRSVLRHDEALLSVVQLTESAIALICLSKSRGAVILSNFEKDQMLTDVKLLALSLTASHAADDELDSQFPAEAAVRLYNVLFRPAEDCLVDVDTIFWTANLEYLPIPVASLLRSMPAQVENGYDLGSADWLVRRYNVAYLGTPSALVASRNPSQLVAATPLRFLGVGDPDLKGNLATGETRISAVMRGVLGRMDSAASLPALPDTREELELTAQSLGNPSLVIVGAEASEGAYRRVPVSQYEYISFATHALIREEIAGLPEAAIVLTPRSSLDSYDDGLLTASEIADLPISSRLVALSACNTANFDLNKFAADVPGLATAFAIAGTPATIATLWPVDSLASKTVVAKTFEYIGGHDALRPAEALAKSQVSFLDSGNGIARAHPRFWAPFVVFGDSPVRSAADEHNSDDLVIIGTHTLTKKGGEMLGATVTKSGDLVVAGIGEWDGNRYAASRASIAPDLSVRWKTDSYEVGGTGIAVEVDAGIVTGGYHWGGESNPVSTPVLQIVDDKGRIASNVKVEIAGYSSFPTSAVKDADGNLIVAISGQKIGGADDPDKYVVFLYRITPSLAILDQARVAIPAVTFPMGVQLARSGSGLVLSVVDKFFTRPTFPMERMMYLNPCMSKPQTWLFNVEAEALSVSAPLSVADVEITRLISVERRPALAIGSEVACDGRRQLTIWQIKSDSLGMIYQENEIVDSIGRGLLVSPSGLIVVSGGVKRMTDIGKAAELSELIDYTPRISFDAREAEDLLVAVLDSDGRAIRRSIISFGSDVYGNVPILRGDQLLVVGTVGNEGTILEFAMPATEKKKLH